MGLGDTRWWEKSKYRSLEIIIDVAPDASVCKCSLRDGERSNPSGDCRALLCTHMQYSAFIFSVCIVCCGTQQCTKYSVKNTSPFSFRPKTFGTVMSLNDHFSKVNRKSFISLTKLLNLRRGLQMMEFFFAQVLSLKIILPFGFYVLISITFRFFPIYYAQNITTNIGDSNLAGEKHKH